MRTHDEAATGVRLILVMFLVCASCALAACSARSASSTPPAAETLPPAEVVAPEPAPEPSFDPSSGPVVAVIEDLQSDSSYSLSLEQVDPDTGETKTFFQASIGDGIKPTFAPYVQWNYVPLRGWYRQQLFDPKLTRMAVNRVDSSDGSEHVGWLESDGTFTDVTERIAPSSSDFAALPKQGNALFDSKGNFVYVDFETKKLYRVDAETLKPVATPIDVANAYGNITDNYMLRPDDSAFPADEFDWSQIFVTHDITSQDSAGGGKLLFAVHEGESWVLKIAKENELAKASALTPKTDWQIIDASISSDGNRIAFTGIRGKEVALFLVPADGSAEPTKIMDMDNASTLMFWK